MYYLHPPTLFGRSTPIDLGLVHAIGSTTEGCDRVSQPERSGGIPACPADPFRFYEGVDARSVKSGKGLRVVELHRGDVISSISEKSDFV